MLKVEKVTPVTTTQEKTTKNVHQKNLPHEPASRFRRSFIADAENHSLVSCHSSDSLLPLLLFLSPLHSKPLTLGKVTETKSGLLSTLMGCYKEREPLRRLLFAVSAISAIHLALYAVVKVSVGCSSKTHPPPYTPLPPNQIWPPHTKLTRSAI